MPDLRNYLENECPLDKNQRTRGLGGLVRCSNGFIGPFSDKDNSDPACYRYSWLQSEPSIESIGAGHREKQKMEDSIRRIMQRDTSDDENSIDER